MKEQNGIYFMHYRNINGATVEPRGGVTFAIRPTGGNVLEVGVARCSRRDVFDRKLGRNIAEGRLNAYTEGRHGSDESQGKFYTIVVEGGLDKTVKEVIHTAFGQELAEEGYF